jgi:uncharacterized radical SAM superfamily Fe-S cluster-containing enzyme
MTELYDQTESLCPHCLRRIAARRINSTGAVYLEKSCPEHGDLEKVLLWRQHPIPYGAWNRAGKEAARASSEDALPVAPMLKGCPYECGICPSHKQSTCSAIIEVTRRCDLRCPVCFAASDTQAVAHPGLMRIERMLKTIRDSGGLCPLQLSGGEPTLRNDLPRIITMARKIGFDHIQVNTNGVRLAQDADFAQALKDAGTTDYFLQFDGVTDEVYRPIRGTELWSLKQKALERCASLKIGVILVPTLVRNINYTHIGSIIQFAKKWIPFVRGVHFQPMTYLGRYPCSPRNEDRVLISDVLMAIEEQTGGELKVANFVPPG